MKKGLMVCLITLVITVCSANRASAVEYAYFKHAGLAIGQDLAIINDKIITLDVPPYVRAGRTLVPLRLLETLLGAEINWDAKTQTAALKFKDKEIKVAIGSQTAMVNGASVSLDVPAEISSGRTFVPLRFLSENLGAIVTFTPENKYINIIVSYINFDGWHKFRDNSTGVSIKYPGDWKAVSKVNVLQLTTLNNSQIVFKPRFNKMDEVVKQKRAQYNTDGWQIINDNPLPSYFKYSGFSINAVKTLGEKNIYYDIYVFLVGKWVYSLEITGESTYDDALCEQIILNSQA